MFKFLKKKESPSFDINPRDDLTAKECFHLSALLFGGAADGDDDMVDYLCAMGLARHVDVYGDIENPLCAKLVRNGASHFQENK